MPKLADFVDALFIETAKLTQYALNPKSDKGQHKARVFKAVLGYTQDNHQMLLRQIETQALTAEAKLIRADRYGTHFQVDLTIEGLNQRHAIVRTGWLIAPEASTARLTTLYLRREL